MPLYEYACPACRKDFEILVRGDEKPECPACGGKRLEKLLSVPAAPSIGGTSLPVCSPTPSVGCGAPRCGMGGGMGGCQRGM